MLTKLTRSLAWLRDSNFVAVHAAAAAACAAKFRIISELPTGSSFIGVCRLSNRIIVGVAFAKLNSRFYTHAHTQPTTLLVVLLGEPCESCAPQYSSAAPLIESNLASARV